MTTILLCYGAEASIKGGFLVRPDSSLLLPFFPNSPATTHSVQHLLFTEMVSLRSLFAGAVLLAAPVMASLDAWEVAKGLRALNIETHRIEYAAVHIAPANAWAPPDRSPIHVGVRTG